MTTSDSEDFESADEEIEPDSSVCKSKSKNPQELKVKPGENKTSDLADAVRGISSLSLHGNYQNKLENDCSTKLSDSSTEPIGDINDETVLEKNETHEKEEADPLVSIDSSSCVEESVKEVSPEPTNQKSKSQRVKRPQKTKENKAGPMKLGVRISTGGDKSVQNIDEPAEKPSSIATEGNNEAVEEKKPESEAYTSLLDKMSGASTKEMESEKFMNKREPEQQEAEQPTGWGFGKSLIGSSAWGNVGGWGSSLFNSASLSVSTLGSHVTQGISTVLETVEAGIGAPSPEDLAKKLREEEELNKLNEKDGATKEEENQKDICSGEVEMEEPWGDWSEEDHGEGESGKTGAGLFSLVTGVTQVTGKVLSTGLDTLEVIGKKTMEVLQEGDPGLKKKRALLLGNDDNVILSQVLREAKEKAETEALLAEEKEAMRKAHFETLFDDFQGLVHLEALEMLSRQSDLRLKSLLLKETGASLRGLQIRLAAVQEMCEIPEHDEDEESSVSLTENLPELLKTLKIGISAEKVTKSCKESFGKLEDMKKESEDESKLTARIIHQEAITALAILTANSIELFHKVTELLMVKEGKSREVKDEAKAMAEITAILTSEVNKIAAAYSDLLSTTLNDDSLSAADKEKIESSITSIFLEASNSSTYIQDAFQLMVPILQLGAVV